MEKTSMHQINIYLVQGRCVPNPYRMHDLAHDAEWEPYNLYDLGRVSWDASVNIIHIPHDI